MILTVTWFLAAGLKWGHEAIEQKSAYFHGIAWSAPAAQTVAVLISSKIEGDVFSGVSTRFKFAIETLSAMNVEHPDFQLSCIFLFSGYGTAFALAHITT